ncbi:MAG: MgtC/SapB family protein [Spirochaetota bacterium]|nr:MgtC/SapB family protein [Spirochaetota bacterium]
MIEIFDFLNNEIHILTVSFKLFFALLCGGVIGFERGRHNQPAGLRTHIIISVGACLIMILSIYIGNTYDSDPSRIAAQVVSGIGFLGGAAIIRFKYAIKGVTTVATIWTTAGIGLTIGGGLYSASLIATGIVIFSLIVLSHWEKRVLKTTSIKKITIYANRNIDLVSTIFALLKTYKITINSFGLTEDMTKNLLEINFNIKLPTQINVSSLFYDITSMKDILKVDLE